jgi:hypothetical protein
MKQQHCSAIFSTRFFNTDGPHCATALPGADLFFALGHAGRRLK